MNRKTTMIKSILKSVLEKSGKTKKDKIMEENLDTLRFNYNEARVAQGQSFNILIDAVYQNAKECGIVVARKRLVEDSYYRNSLIDKINVKYDEENAV